MPEILTWTSAAFLATLAAGDPVSAAVPVEPPKAGTQQMTQKRTTIGTFHARSRQAKRVRRSIRLGHSVPIRTLREIADREGDGVIAYRLANYLRDNNGTVSDTAHYYAVAATDGAGGAIIQLIRQLQLPGAEKISIARLEWIERVLENAADAGDARARSFLVEAWRTGHPFGRQAARVVDLQLEAAREGDAEAALDVAVQIMRGTELSDADRILAVEMIETADTNGDIATRVTAQNLRRILETEDDR